MGRLHWSLMAAQGPQRRLSWRQMSALGGWPPRSRVGSGRRARTWCACCEESAAAPGKSWCPPASSAPARSDFSLSGPKFNQGRYKNACLHKAFLYSLWNTLATRSKVTNRGNRQHAAKHVELWLCSSPSERMDVLKTGAFQHCSA